MRPVLAEGSERNRRMMTGIKKRGARRLRHLVGPVPNALRVLIGSNGRVLRRVLRQVLLRLRVKATGLWPLLGRTRGMGKTAGVNPSCLEMILMAKMEVPMLRKVNTVSAVVSPISLEFV